MKNPSKTAFIRYAEIKMKDMIDTHFVGVPEDILLSVLSNILVRSLINLKLKKKDFIKQISDGWDYHEEQSLK